MALLSVDNTGQRRWNGRTFDEIIAARTDPRRISIGSDGIYWEGTVRAGIKEGVWVCAQFVEGQRTDKYEALFDNNTVVGEVKVLDPASPHIDKEMVMQATLLPLHRSQ
jgi:hypothetical protein